MYCLKKDAGCLLRNPEMYILNDTAVSASMSTIGLGLPGFIFASLGGNFLSSQVKQEKEAITGYTFLRLVAFRLQVVESWEVFALRFQWMHKKNEPVNRLSDPYLH